MFTASLDQPIADGTNLHDLVGPQHPGGACPRPLTSSWMMNERQVAPPRIPKMIFYLDALDGTTVAQARTLALAYECQRRLRGEGLRVIVRPFCIDDDSYEAERVVHKFKSQHGML